ncbi:MAG: hypothetical protein E7042_07740 [Lentisphaerae bacterium]|nr:hypothetical protein [Lentisphaerota bacterium]
MIDFESVIDLGTITVDKVFDDLTFSSMSIGGAIFSFTVTRECYLSLKITDSSEIMSGMIQVCDEDSNPFMLGVNGDGIFVPGTYYIFTDPVGFQSGKLIFDTEDILATGNDSIENACDLGEIEGENSFSGVYLQGYTAYYKFTLPQDGILTFCADSSTDYMSPSVALYHDDAIYIGSGIPGEAIVAELEAGTYIIALDGHDMMVSMNFELEQVISGNNSIETAHDLGTITGEMSFEQIFLKQYEDDYFRFTIDKECRLCINALANQEWKMMQITVYDENYNKIDLGDGSVVNAEFLTGTYYLKLNSSDTKVTLNFIQEECKDNTSLSNASPLGNIKDVMYLENMLVSSVPEYYSFSLDEDSVITTRLQADVPHTVTFFNESGQKIYHNVFQKSGDIKFELDAGNYYVSVESDQLNRCNIVFLQELDEVDETDPAHAPELSKDSLKGTYFKKNEVKYYSFYLSEPQMICFDLPSDSGLKVTNVFPEGYYPDIYGEISVFQNNYGYCCDLKSSGYYLLEVSSEREQVVSDDLSISYLDGNILANNSQNFSFASAAYIGIDGFVSFCNISQQARYYKFDVTRGAPVVNITALGDAEIILYDLSGNVLSSSAEDAWTLAPGSYYVSIRSCDDDIIDSFHIEKSGLGVVRGNNSWDDSLELGDLSIPVEFTAEDDGEKYFKFTLDSEESILIAAQNASAKAFNNIGIELYDENQKLISRNTNYLLQNNLESGTYYARVQDNTSNKKEQSSFSIVLTAVDTDSKYNGKVLLNTLWRQDYPYNMYCPTINNARCVTGCGSTAASQVAYYWIKLGYLNSLYLYLDESNSYESFDTFSTDGTYSPAQYYEISDSEAAAAAAGYLPFDKVNEIIAAGNINSTEFIAALCFSVGVYSKALYGTRGTETSNEHIGNEAALNVQRYSNGAFGGQDIPPKTSSIPVDKLIEDLLAGHPVLASTAPVTNMIVASHAIVIDGYNSLNDTFHINVGWGGNSDGWYSRQVLADCLFYTTFVPAEYLAVETTACIEAEYLQISFDDFNSILNISTPDDMNGVVLYNYSEGNYIAEPDVEATRLKSVINAPVPKMVAGETDNFLDVMFAKSFEIWNSTFEAQHQGIVGEWNGTGDRVKLFGKNKICDVFVGSEEYTELYLTDDHNGDALFVDDIFSDSYLGVGNLSSRVNYIDKIYAGAGDDIIDFTSQRFTYFGDGIEIYGGDGNDTIWTNSGSNLIFGDAGNDNIIGGNNDDIISGGSGNDTMHGGGGYDIFCFGGDWGNDTVEQLSDGTAILWFEDDNGEWDELTRTYTAGENSVTFAGNGTVTVICGSEIGEEHFAAIDSLGCFSEAAFGKIFKDNGVLA